MVDLGDYIVSEELFEECFSCDLAVCKGECCVEGDSGAPLEVDEIELIDEHLETIKKYMKEEGIDVVDNEGIFEIDSDGDYTTTLIDGKECSFSVNENGITLCAIEKAYRAGEIPNIKPISCSLYPIRAKQFSNGLIGLNYHRWNVCKCAVLKGQKENIKVYQSLKEPIIRAYGDELYEELCKADELLNSSASVKL